MHVGQSTWKAERAFLLFYGLYWFSVLDMPQGSMFTGIVKSSGINAWYLTSDVLLAPYREWGSTDANDK